MELVVSKNDNLVTTTTAIAEGTGNQHKAVIQLVRNYADDLDTFGRVAFEMAPFETNGGTQYREVAYLNEHQATLIMTYMRNTEVIRKFKVRLVKTFYDMAEELRRQSQQITIPKNMPEALRLAADLAEKNAQLAYEAEKAKPKIAFHDGVRACPDTMEIGRFAKIIGTGRNRLFSWLRDEKILMKSNLPYQQFCDAGYFRVVERMITINGEDKLKSTTYITGKGQVYVQKRWNAAQDTEKGAA